TTTTATSTTSTTTTRPINSLKYYDIAEGTRSSPVAPGDTVTVHFDCIFRKIDAVSTRSARLLGANRVLAEPFSFPAASKLDAPRAITTDAGGGLFTGQSGPKPPQALSYAVVGMKVGGKRSVLVPAALGYGSKGEQEIPPNCQEFELQIEVLGIGAESP
ncbi:MAG: FKBP-type peptidyl-prolyl cis-trans isomerase, partial [bacterium]